MTNGLRVERRYLGPELVLVQAAWTAIELARLQVQSFAQRGRPAFTERNLGIGSVNQNLAAASSPADGSKLWTELTLLRSFNFIMSS